MHSLKGPQYGLFSFPRQRGIKKCSGSFIATCEESSACKSMWGIYDSETRCLHCRSDGEMSPNVPTSLHIAGKSEIHLVSQPLVGMEVHLSEEAGHQWEERCLVALLSLECSAEGAGAQARCLQLALDCSVEEADAGPHCLQALPK